MSKLAVKEPLIFNNTQFYYAWSQNTDTHYFQEYLPAGEQLENFNEMMILHFFTNAKPVENVVRDKMDELEQRKQTDPLCDYMVSASPDNTLFIVDFIISSITDEKSVAEFNIYQFQSIDLGDGQQGLILYAYCKRAYDNDIDMLLESLETERTALVELMSQTDIPEISIV